MPDFMLIAWIGSWLFKSMHLVKILPDRLAERSKFAKERQESTLFFGTRKSVVTWTCTWSMSLKASFCVSKLTAKKCIGDSEQYFCNVSLFKDSLQWFVEKKLVVLMSWKSSKMLILLSSCASHCLPVSPANNSCKLFGPRSGLTISSA